MGGQQDGNRLSKVPGLSDTVIVHTDDIDSSYIEPLNVSPRLYWKHTASRVSVLCSSLHMPRLRDARTSLPPKNLHWGKGCES